MIGFSLDYVEYFLISQSSVKLDHYFPQTLLTRRGLDSLFKMNIGDWKNYILRKFLAFIHINNHHMNVKTIKGSIIYKRLLTFQYASETTSMCHTEKYV